MSDGKTFDLGLLGYLGRLDHSGMTSFARLFRQFGSVGPLVDEKINPLRQANTRLTWPGVRDIGYLTTGS